MKFAYWMQVVTARSVCFILFNGGTPLLPYLSSLLPQSSWLMWLPSFLPSPVTFPTPVLNNPPADQSLSPSISFLPLACGTCEPWEKSELHLLNCYLLSLLTQDKTLICSGCNMAYLLRKLVRGPDHLTPLGHDSASWNRADAASRRGTGSLSGDAILFVHLHLPKYWRSLFISFWEATCTSFRAFPSWPPSKDLTLQPKSTLQFPYIKGIFLMSMKKRHEFIFYYCSVSHLKLEQITTEESMGTILKCAEWLWLGERGWGRREES